MTAITVRTMLAAILENNMQMDDEICFELTDLTRDIIQEGLADLDLIDVGCYRSKLSCKPNKLIFEFDLTIDIKKRE